MILLLVLHVPSGPAELVLALPFYFCFFCIRKIVATSGHIQNKQHSCTECVESKERHKVDWINAYIADKKIDPAPAVEIKEIALFLLSSIPDTALLTLAFCLCPIAEATKT